MNYYRSSTEFELPEDALDLLAKYEQVSSYLVPASTNTSPANTLWHPDLHLNNIFVDPTSHKIIGIVDWQSAAEAPLFYRSGVHQAFRHYKPVREGWVVPEKPKDYDILTTDEQKQIDKDLESGTIHKYYQLQTKKRAPLHWNVLEQLSVRTLRRPVALVTGVWENCELFFLRDALIALVAQWSELFGEDTPCPISFSTEETDFHTKEEENVDGVAQILELLEEQGILPADGVVSPEDYQTAVDNCCEYKQILLKAAQNETERAMFNRLWPY